MMGDPLACRGMLIFYFEVAMTVFVGVRVIPSRSLWSLEKHIVFRVSCFKQDSD